MCVVGILVTFSVVVFDLGVGPRLGFRIPEGEIRPASFCTTLDMEFLTSTVSCRSGSANIRHEQQQVPIGIVVGCA